MAKPGPKGRAGELELCKMLGDVFESSFIRTDRSGSYIGGKNNWRKQYMSEAQIRSKKADIVPPEHLTRLILECKWYKDFPYHAFAKNDQIPLLNGWITDLEYDCDSKDIGIICIKINSRGWMVVFNKVLINKFKLQNHVIYNDYIVTGLNSFLTDNRKAIELLCE